MTTRGTNDKLCAITDAKRANELAGEPAFVCARCGAKSHVSANVCEAIRLPDAG